jgi:hypothetical protein
MKLTQKTVINRAIRGLERTFYFIRDILGIP